jgi:cytidylate kinase
VSSASSESNNSNKLIIAIDGPSGSGKSSVSRAVAKQLGLSYLDTGAMYRAMTWWVLEKGIDPIDGEMVFDVAKVAKIIPGTDPSNPTIHVGDVDVSGPIRGDLVTGAVSAVSAVPEVRGLLVELQREISKDAPKGIVVEGRDIGSVVLPDASLKLYITADPEARAARRAAENGQDVSTTQEKLVKRDQADSTRKVSPLEMAADAMLLDTTHMNLDEVVDHVLGLVKGLSDAFK